MNHNYSQVLLSIDKIIKVFVTQDKRELISDIIASHIDIPWKKQEINKKMGSTWRVLLHLLQSRALAKWAIKNVNYGLFLFGAILVSVARRTKQNEALVLVYSLTPNQLIEGTINLRKFLTDERLGLAINESTRIIVEQPEISWKYQSKSSNVIIVKNVSLFYFQEYMSFSQRLKFLFHVLFRVFQLMLSGKLIELLFFRQTILETKINQQIIENHAYSWLITTQSNLRKLPTIFYLKSLSNTRRIMIWYSNNSFVIEKRNEIDQFDSTRHLRSNIDLHLGWGERWKLELESINPKSKVQAVGSLVWYPIPAKLHHKNLKNLTIFDVTPYSRFKHYDFYSYEIVSSFILDIVTSISELKKDNDQFRNDMIFLKQKRSILRDIDSRYAEFIKLMEYKSSFKILKSEQNLYHLIGSSKVVIGLPFTSPVFIAKELGVPSCYYVSDIESDWVFPRELDGVNLISGKYDLKKWLSDNL